MSNDENTRILPGRREAIKLGVGGALGTVGAIALAGAAATSGIPVWALGPNTVILTPEAEEVPYFVEERLNRSDIRTDPADRSIQLGHPLALNVTVMQLRKDVVTPLEGAQVDV